jgi:four helix bundle protein
MKLSDRIWTLVLNWKHFERVTIGTQITRAADSVAANLSEGYGRYHFKENRQFCYYARGSLLETRTWLEKARSRDLIAETEFDELTATIDLLGKRINAYINSIGRNPGTAE